MSAQRITLQQFSNLTNLQDLHIIQHDNDIRHTWPMRVAVPASWTGSLLLNAFAYIVGCLFMLHCPFESATTRDV